MITFTGKQATLYDPPPGTKLIVACGQGQSGKSIANIFGRLQDWQFNYNNAAFMMATFGDPAWRDVVKKYVEWWCDVSNSTLDYTSKGFEITTVHPDTNRTHVNRYIRITANNVSAVTRMQGPTISGVYATEGAAFPMDVLSEFLTRMVTIPKAVLSIDCNPEGNEHHPFKTDWIDRIVRTNEGTLKEGEKPLNNAIYLEFEWDDNPVMTPVLREQYMSGMPEGTQKDRKGRGLWTSRDGVIHDLVKHKFFVNQPPSPTPKYYEVAVDTATTGTTAAYLCGVWPSKYIVVDEYYHEGQLSGTRSAAEHIRHIVDKFRHHLMDGTQIRRWTHDVGDSFGPSLKEAQRIGLIDHRTAFQVAMKGTEEGIDRVNWCLERGLLKGLADKLPKLDRDCGLYINDQKARDEGYFKPSSAGSHGPNAIEYLMTTLLKKPAGTPPAKVVRRGR